MIQDERLFWSKTSEKTDCGDDAMTCKHENSVVDAMVLAQEKRNQMIATAIASITDAIASATLPPLSIAAKCAA